MRPFIKLIKNLFPLGLALLIASCAATRPNIAIPATQPPAPQALKMQPRVVVVLGGGGARGMAHVGVLKVLQKEQIPVDLIVGTSAGSIIGALYAADPSARAIKQAVLQASLFNILDLSFSKTGPVSGYALQDFLIKHFKADNFDELKIPFIAVATDLKTGQTIALDSGPLAPAVNASAAVPLIFHPVSLYGHTLVDGGVTDLVPVDIAKRYHPEIIIAVSVIPDIPQQIPTNIIGVYNRAYNYADARFAQYNMEGANIRIHPNVGQIGMFDGSDRTQLMQAGQRAAEQALPAICALLKEKNIPSKCS